MKTQSRIIYYDILNIFACFAVICLHQNGIVHWYNINTIEFKQSLIAEVLFYWAVPIFFMLSGATLLGYRERYSTKTFFLKRFQRTVIPFIVFTIIMMVWRSHTGDFVLQNHSIATFVNAIIHTKPESIYWFFIPLFAMYMCIPVLSVLKDNRAILWYMVGLSFITLSILPIACDFTDFDWNASLEFPMAGNYLMFTILGYLLATTDFSKMKRYILYASGIFSILLRYFGTLYLSNKIGHLDRSLFGYLQFHSVLLAASVFVIFKHIPWSRLISSDKCIKTISTISACSFGIFLIHPIIQYYEQYWLMLTPESLIYRSAGCFLTYIVALVIILLLKKLPLIKNIIP